jgi:hypothetical protein
MSDANEEYVRSKWDSVQEIDSTTVEIITFDGARRFYGLRHKWELARAFHDARLEEIRQVERELDMISRQLDAQPDAEQVMFYSAEDVRNSQRNVCSWNRILSRTQAHLEQLKKGMKA